MAEQPRGVKPGKGVRPIQPHEPSPERPPDEPVPERPPEPETAEGDEGAVGKNVEPEE